MSCIQYQISRPSPAICEYFAKQATKLPRCTYYCYIGSAVKPLYDKSSNIYYIKEKLVIGSLKLLHSRAITLEQRYI